MAVKSRIAIDALIIKYYKQLSDEETIQEIWDFDPSLFVTIRKSLPARTIETINEKFIDKVKEYEKIKDEKKRTCKSKKPPKSSGGGDKQVTLPGMESTKNKGKLTRLNDAVGQVVDATIAPSNIKYPTDLDLLNDSRKISERLIGKLYSSKRRCMLIKATVSRIGSLVFINHIFVRWSGEKSVWILNLAPKYR